LSNLLNQAPLPPAKKSFTINE